MSRTRIQIRVAVHSRDWDKVLMRARPAKAVYAVPNVADKRKVRV